MIVSQVCIMIGILTEFSRQLKLNKFFVESKKSLFFL